MNINIAIGSVLLGVWLWGTSTQPAYAQAAYLQRHQVAEQAAELAEYMTSELQNKAEREGAAKGVFTNEATIRGVLKFTGDKGYLIKHRLQEIQLPPQRRFIGEPVLVGSGNTEAEVLANRKDDGWNVVPGPDDKGLLNNWKEIPGFYTWVTVRPNGRLSYGHVPAQFSRAAERKAEELISKKQVLLAASEFQRSERLASAIRALQSEAKDAEARRSLQSLHDSILSTDAEVKRIEGKLRQDLAAAREAAATAAALRNLGSIVSPALLIASAQSSLPAAKQELASAKTPAAALTIVERYQSTTDGRITDSRRELSIAFKGNADQLSKLSALIPNPLRSEVGRLLNPPSRSMPSAGVLDPLPVALPPLTRGCVGAGCQIRQPR